jgi:hypothetical protein
MMTGSDTNVEIQSKPGMCPTHGAVRATRAVPRLRFPFFVYGPLRLIAGRRAFRCPRCGATATGD